MTEFGAAAELSLELKPGEAAAVRQELEDELSDVGIATGGAAGALGGGATSGSALTDGGLDAVTSELATQTDILEDLLDEVERGVGGGGGGGPSPLSIGAGTAAASAGASSASTLLSRFARAKSVRAFLTGGASVTGGVASPVVTDDQVKGSVDFVEQFTGGDPGRDAAEVPSAQGGRAPLSPFNFIESGRTGQEGLEQAAGVAEFAGSLAGFSGGGSESTPDWLTQTENILDKSPDKPGWLAEMDTILQQSPDKPDWLSQMEQITGTEPTNTSDSTPDADINAGSNGSLQAGTDPTAGGSGGTGTTRQQTTVNVDVTAERAARRELEQAMEEAKQQAVREVERKMTQSGARLTR